MKLNLALIVCQVPGSAPLTVTDVEMRGVQAGGWAEPSSWKHTVISDGRAFTSACVNTRPVRASFSVYESSKSGLSTVVPLIGL